MKRRPRILITGFSVFPGAPVNPTERLIEALAADPERLAAHGDLSLQVLAVEYASLPARLERIGATFPPDIAIHFGLSAKAEGFTLERLARNEIAQGRPDNAGAQPAAFKIAEGGANLPSSLPLADIHAALTQAGLPVSWSDDAGGYLCNFLFYLSRTGTCAGFAPPMSGFIHVPPLAGEADAPGNAITLDMLIAGAAAIVEACTASWHRSAGQPVTGWR
jgi:pyroglutamyl-peptidase